MAKQFQTLSIKITPESKERISARLIAKKIAGAKAQNGGSAKINALLDSPETSIVRNTDRYPRWFTLSV